jgi:CubicO group peptidase (beta-lactamase class C family)
MLKALVVDSYLSRARTVTTYVPVRVFGVLAADRLSPPVLTRYRPAVAMRDELALALEAAAREHHVPGAAAGVLVGDECITAAYGVANVDSPAAVTPASLFQVGSISKTFTSAAVMLLVQEGRLALEDPVAKHLPDLGPATGLDLEAITVERALSHQAGFDGDHLFVAREWDDLTTLRGARRLFAPGTGYSYNNAGFSIVGAIITAVSGESFESFVRNRLLRPLGMRSAGFTADEVITSPVAAPHWVNGANAHVIRGAGWQPGWELGPVDRPAGGLIASVEHLMTWCRFQWTGTALDGSEILSRESLGRLHSPVVEATCIEDIGLDWFVWQIDGADAFGHGGLTAGYASDLVVVPAHDFAFVGLTNGTNGAMVYDAVRRWALQRFAGLDEHDPEPDPGLRIDVDRFTGRYLHAFSLLTVTSGAAPGTILVTASKRDDLDETSWQPPIDPPFSCGFFNHDHAVSVSPPGSPRVARFGGDRDGRAEWLLWSSRRAPRVD